MRLYALMQLIADQLMQLIPHRIEIGGVIFDAVIRYRSRVATVIF